MKGDKMFEAYAKYVGDNEKEIVDDFCSKIKKDLVGDLTLDEYSRFRFWTNHTEDELRHFHRRFKDETKDNMPYNIFCELMWHSLDDIAPDGLKDVIDSIKGMQIGQA